MSYSVPGPGQDGFFRKRKKDEETSAVARARQAAEELSGKPPGKGTEIASSPLMRREEQNTNAGPPVLERLLRHEEERASARATGDTLLADRALVQVVGDLGELLDYAANHLRQTDDARARQLVRQAAPQLAAMRGVAALPLEEMADFLGVPRAKVKEVQRTLAQHGGITPAERRQALEQVNWLRGQLREVADTKDHSLLDRVIRFISKFALFGVITVSSAAAGALAVGESVVKEVIKAAAVALVAAALHLAADHLLEQRGKDSRPSAAHDAHVALVAALPEAHVLWGDPAYDGEHAVVRIKLGIRCCAARVASLSLDWPEKRRYWRLLDQVVQALNADSPAELAPLLRGIKALHPPAA